MTKGKYKTVDVSKPLNGRVVVMNRHWLCVDGDPSKAVIYDETPQCNAHQSIVDRMLRYTKERTGWNVEAVFIEVAYRPQITHWQNA